MALIKIFSCSVDLEIWEYIVLAELGYHLMHNCITWSTDRFSIATPRAYLTNQEIVDHERLLSDITSPQADMKVAEEDGRVWRTPSTVAR